jgi:hypothetical protein
MLELIDDDIISPTNLTRKQTADIQSRNDTSLSKPIWTDDDEQINVSDEYTPGERTSTSQSIVFPHQNNSNAITPMPTLPQVIKKSSLPSATQQFYHHHKPLNNEQQPQNKSSPRPFIPLTLTKCRRIPSNVHLTTSSSQQQQTFTGAASSNSSSHDLIHNGGTGGVGINSNNTDSFNEHLMLNKRIEILKTPGKQQPTAPSPTNTTFPPPPPPPPSSKRHFQQQDMKSVGTTTNVPSTSSSLIPIDSTKVTIGKPNESVGIIEINKKSHVFLFRNNWS